MSSRLWPILAVVILLGALGTDLAFAQGPGNQPFGRNPPAPAPPGWVERSFWAMAYFTVTYLVIMAVMALGGVLLASKTRGTGALHLLGAQSDEMITEGQVIR